MKRTRILIVVAAVALATASAWRGRADDAPGAHPAFPERLVARASAAFSSVWRDGKAEVSGYRAVVPRYGALRAGELALIYVTEPMDRRTWIKDDDAPDARRVDVLKLNASLKFLTGVYPYSVMTSVFSPLDDWGRGPRFSPVKLTLTAQEWCGQVFQAAWPGADRVQTRVDSYFASEGETSGVVPVPEGALYEDALLIQLRELDGPFAGGGDWSGQLVPSLWRLRRAHVPLAPVASTITRSTADAGGVAVTRFVLTSGDYRRTFDVERAAPRRVLAWTTSEGDDVRLLGTERMAYWSLHDPGDEARRGPLGLAPADAPPPIPPPEGTRAIGR